jgi:anti-sigma factor RsiW
MNCNWVREHLEAYTLGLLEADARELVERHLIDCADCRRLSDELAAATHLIPLGLAAASPLRPPAELKARVLQRVHASAPGSASRFAGGANADSADLRPNSDVSVRPASITTRPNWLRPRVVAAIAACLVLALALAWGVRLSEALDRERAMRERVTEHFSQQQEIVLEVVDSDEARRVILRSPDPDSNAYGKVFTRPDVPHVVAMAARLPVPADGQTYHLWLTSEGRTIFAGVLPVNDQGFGLLTFDADRAGPSYDAALLTLQAAGDTAPGGQTILAWDAEEP